MNSISSLLAQDKVTDDDVFQMWSKRASDYGWEGIMLRADEPYKGKRSKDLLKVKKPLMTARTAVAVVV